MEKCQKYGLYKQDLLKDTMVLNFSFKVYQYIPK
jgi:hypothetical protein